MDKDMAKAKTDFIPIIFWSSLMEKKEISEELYKILVKCETAKEYHQAIVELKNKIEVKEST